MLMNRSTRTRCSPIVSLPTSVRPWTAAKQVEARSPCLSSSPPRMIGWVLSCPPPPPPPARPEAGEEARDDLGVATSAEPHAPAQEGEVHLGPGVGAVGDAEVEHDVGAVLEVGQDVQPVTTYRYSRNR
jgi:hypothetical protein